MWQPHNVQMGAGTGNPATLLSVLGPEPARGICRAEHPPRRWPLRRKPQPDAVFLIPGHFKPDPGNPQEIYLASLEALGINRAARHPFRGRQLEPALGAWGWAGKCGSRAGDHAAHLLPAGGRPTLDPVSVGSPGLGASKAGAARQSAVWDIDWNRRHLRRRAAAAGDRARRYYFRSRTSRASSRRSTSTSANTRALARAVTRPTTGAQMQPRSTCSIRAARLASPSVRATSGACAI